MKKNDLMVEYKFDYEKMYSEVIAKVYDLEKKLEFEERIARDYEKQKDKMYMNWLKACEERKELFEENKKLREIIEKYQPYFKGIDMLEVIDNVYEKK